MAVFKSKLIITIFFIDKLSEPPVERFFFYPIQRINFQASAKIREEQLPFGVELEKESGALTISQTALTQFVFSSPLPFPPVPEMPGAVSSEALWKLWSKSGWFLFLCCWLMIQPSLVSLHCHLSICFPDSKMSLLSPLLFSPSLWIYIFKKYVLSWL